MTGSATSFKRSLHNCNKLIQLNIKNTVSQALLKGDKDQIRKQADRLGVGKYYGLFACMVASRTWDDITGSGIADKNSNLDVNRLQVLITSSE